MTSNDTHVLLGIEAKDRDRAVGDYHADDTRSNTAVHFRRKSACLIAGLDEKQHGGP